MASVEFDSVTIAVEGAVVLRDVPLDISDGEFVGVIGPSGSGKTSLIRTIAGFTDIVRAPLLLDGIDVTRTKTADRDVGMVFQGPVMFRRRNVRRNVSFPLEIRRQEAEEIRDRVDAEARTMHFQHLLARRPDELSRGETQLVQIARAMVRTLRLLLLDGPVVATVTTIVPGGPGGAICDVRGWRCGLTLPAVVREGDIVRLQVDHLVVFDNVTGRAIA